MKKFVFALFLTFALAGSSFAEEATMSATTSETTVTTTSNSTSVDNATAAVNNAMGAAPEEAPKTAATETTTTSTTTTTETASTDSGENLEFISGEVSALDEANKMITIKLYGETENTPGEKSITVVVDSSTDITDGEKDRDLKSLTAGTEVDVEYDPSSTKATYIFVY